MSGEDGVVLAHPPMHTLGAPMSLGLPPGSSVGVGLRLKTFLALGLGFD